MKVIDVLRRGRLRQVSAPARAEQKIRKVVREGAKVLDQVLPEWYTTRFIKLSNLALEDSCKCVYGQLEDAVLANDIEFDKFHIDIVNRILGSELYDESTPAYHVIDSFETSDFGYTPPDEATTAIFKALNKDKKVAEGSRGYWRVHDEADNVAYAILQDEWEQQIRSRRGKAVTA